MAKKSKKKRKSQKKYQFATTASSNRSASKVTAPQNEAAIKKSAQTSDKKSESVVNSTTIKHKNEENAQASKVMIREARLTATIGGVIVVSLIIIWMLFEHTSVGPHIYNLIRF